MYLTPQKGDSAVYLTPQKVDSAVYMPRGFHIQISPWIFDKNLNHPKIILNGTRRSYLMQKTKTQKSRVPIWLTLVFLKTIILIILSLKFVTIYLIFKEYVCRNVPPTWNENIHLGQFPHVVLNISRKFVQILRKSRHFNSPANQLIASYRASIDFLYLDKCMRM